jgi:hypothetical protein
MRFIEGEPYIDYQIAHIRDANPGNRYVEAMTDDQRRSFENLILLCKPHHELVDKRHPDRYSIEDLDEWKRLREGSFAEQLAEVGPVTEDFLADVLTQSMVEVQEQLTDALFEQEDAAMRRVEAIREDLSIERVQDAFDVAAEFSLLSPLGVRADAFPTEFYLRIQRDGGEGLVVHLDTMTQASLFNERWGPGQSFSEVMLLLAKRVQPTPLWPGSNAWNFQGALESIIDVILCGIRMKASGRSVDRIVQLVGNWILSDWDAQAVDRGYQVTYHRLDESDWYDHLSEKTWTDSGEVAQMLDHGMFLRQLAQGME